MLATTTANIAFGVTYDRNGKTTDALLRSEPARPIVATADHGSTTTEKYKDKVTLSADGREQSQREESPGSEEATTKATGAGGKDKTKGQQPVPAEATEVDRDLIRQLKERDLEVRTHEMAHLANAGQYARGGPTYSYQQGPDGRRYAVGGEVPIDLGKEQTPAQTIQKMEVVKRAALAPATPSAADRNIAAAAAALESQAHREQRSEQVNPASATRTDDRAETEDNGTPAPSAEAPASRHRLANNVFA